MRRGKEVKKGDYGIPSICMFLIFYSMVKESLHKKVTLEQVSERSKGSLRVVNEQFLKS